MKYLLKPASYEKKSYNCSKSIKRYVRDAYFVSQTEARLFFILKESSPFREPLKLKMPAGSGHDETDGG